MIKIYFAFFVYGAVGDLTPAKVKSCITSSREAGVCVHYYQCNDNGYINKDGNGIIDIRFSDSSCPSYLDVCCKLTTRNDDPVTPRPQQQRFGCGWRNPEGVGLNTKGDKHTTKFGEFPWMVALLKLLPLDSSTNDTFRLYIGGGSLIHPRIVLTAAHIVNEPSKYLARAGEWDTRSTSDVYPYQERSVIDIVIHGKFNKHNLHYDIALVFLSSPMNLAPNVGVVCLPLSHQEPSPGSQCFATGWGKNHFGNQGRYQNILKKVVLPVVEHKMCQSLLRKTRLGPYFVLHDTFMCAGGGPQDTCEGDGGSPLSCPIPNQLNRYMESGIVAWGIDCGQAGNPGVYANVATLRTWIDKNVASRGFDTKVYTF